MNVDFNKFTENSRQAISGAHRLARQCSYSSLEPAVLVVAIMQTDRDMVPFLLGQMNIEKVPFFTALSDTMQQLPHNGSEGAPIAFSPATDRCLPLLSGWHSVTAVGLWRSNTCFGRSTKCRALSRR